MLLVSSLINVVPYKMDAPCACVWLTLVDDRLNACA